VKQLKLVFATALIALFTLSPGASHAADMAPLTQIGSTPLPDVTGGDFALFLLFWLSGLAAQRLGDAPHGASSSTSELFLALL
jgi:hypothetical protein